MTIDNDLSRSAMPPPGKGVARHSVSWRPERGLRMAANVLEAVRNRPSARVSGGVVESFHKTYGGAYLDQKRDRDLISIDTMLRG